jgi:hypothetical protein
MKIFSVVYRPDIDTYYLYDREGQRLFPKPEDESVVHNVRHGFSFHDDWNHPLSLLWADFLNPLEVDPECEYFRQAELGTGTMQDTIARVTSYWLDRGRLDTPAIPKMVQWARDNMTDPRRHTKDVSTLYVKDAAVAAIETVFARYIELVQKRQYQNYGHYWPNAERIELLERRIRGEKFKDIAKKMGRTNPACRAQYGRIRRGEDAVLIELQDFDIFREALPLGMLNTASEKLS